MAWGHIEYSQFESDVISDGTQTFFFARFLACPFESDVISDGTQTMVYFAHSSALFESDVISDGTQTNIGRISFQNSLRVM